MKKLCSWFLSTTYYLPYWPLTSFMLEIKWLYCKMEMILCYFDNTIGSSTHCRQWTIFAELNSKCRSQEKACFHLSLISFCLFVCFFVNTVKHDWNTCLTCNSVPNIWENIHTEMCNFNFHDTISPCSDPFWLCFEMYSSHGHDVASWIIYQLLDESENNLMVRIQMHRQKPYL